MRPFDVDAVADDGRLALHAAVDNVQRLLLYTGALLAAVALLRQPLAARAAEPVLALGALVVIGYGLSGRLVPGVIDLISDRSFGAGGRLEQPITYWNAEGLLAAMGLLLCAADRGRHDARRRDARRRGRRRCAPLGMGVYLSYSRGALAATVLGLLVLLARRPRGRSCAPWRRLGFAVARRRPRDGVRRRGVAARALGDRERDGAIMLVVLAAAMAGGRRGRSRRAREPRAASDGSARCRSRGAARGGRRPPRRYA